MRRRYGWGYPARNYYMQQCESLEYTCIDKATQIIVKTSDFTTCDKSLGFVTSKWECGIATASVSGIPAIDFSTVTAHGFGQFMVLILVCLGVILAYCGFFLGSYIYRK